MGIDLKKDLNQEQFSVVTQAEGPCLVLAGAGSGKTRTITYRVAYLLEQGIDPTNILLVTFTNKAAREMMGRVQFLVGQETKLEWSGTFHHIGHKILRKYAKDLGYKNNFSILDSSDSLDILKSCLKQEGVDRKERRFPSPSVLQNIISYARNAETTIEDVLEIKYEHFLPLVDQIKRIANDYQQKKQSANAMDFDDLLVNWYLLLLKNQKAKQKYSDQFKYILVDEYQDTNKIQASIINLLASVHNNLLVVGDDAQSIYSFRAADIQNILAFEKQYSKAKIFRLETNYRSTPDILDLANNVIANNINQYEKELRSIKNPLAKPELHVFEDQQEEALSIVHRILKLKDEEGIESDKIAVLFRAAYHSQALEMELTKRNIQYEYRGGTRFFERAHIKDALAYLRILNNLDDTIAWSRVLNMQTGIGPASIERVLVSLQNISSQSDLSGLGSLFAANGQIGWSDFCQIWEAMLAVEDRCPGELIRAVIKSKYSEYLENEYSDYRERLQDLEQLALFADNTKDLSQFLGEASLQENYSSVAQSNNEKKLVLSTVHQAKGLEWPAVFVINLAAGHFPNDRASHELNGLEEERRLFYVAITRAQQFLFLSYPLAGGFASYLQGPSVFIQEIDNDLLSSNNRTVFSDLNDEKENIFYEPEKNNLRTGFLKDIDEL